MKRFIYTSVLAALAIGPSASARADAVTRFAAGSTSADLQSAVDGFRTDLGGANNGVGGGPFGSGFRAINWDGVPDSSAANNFLSPTFFNSTSPRGITFSTAGTGFQVSSTTASGIPVRFGNIDPSYSSTFQTFSPQRLFTSLGSPILDLNFSIPSDPSSPAFTRGFGAVFTDVDLSDSTSIEFLDAGNNELYTLFVPPSNGGLSFAGATFNAGEQVARVRIFSGNTALGAGVLDGGQIDLVVMDDFFYGEPMAVPEPSTIALLILAGFGCYRALRARNSLPSR
jgi:hypothetical protein